MPARIESDQQLLTALRERELTAAEALVTAYGERAHRLASRITGNAQDAEEAVQDAFWSVVRTIDAFRGDASLGFWIYRITTNAAYQKLRDRARRCDDIPLGKVLPVLEEVDPHLGPSSDRSATTDDPAGHAELRAMLVSAIGNLPAQYRAVIVLHHVQGLSLAEVAGSVGITRAAAKSRAHRARLLLRNRLARCRATWLNPASVDAIQAPDLRDGDP